MGKGFQIILLDCYDKALKIARYLRLFTNISTSESMSVVAKTPCILFECVSENTKKNIAKAFAYYGIKYEIKQSEKYADKSDSNLKRIIFLGASNNKNLSRVDYIYLGRQYNFDFMVDFSKAPFIIRDGITENTANLIHKELKTIGVYAQILDSIDNQNPIASSLNSSDIRFSKPHSINNTFLEQLNDASCNKEDVIKEHKNLEKSKCTEKAKYEYDNLKKQLLDQVSKGNYTEFNGKKYISYLYNPLFVPCDYIYDNGIRHEIAGVFNKKLKTTNTGIKKYTPRYPDKWNYYINELKQLGTKDEIEIIAVMCSNYYDGVMYSFPTVTSDKRFVLSAGLYLKCSAMF